MIHELSSFQWYTNMGKCNFIIEVYRTYKCLYIDTSIILINILMLNLPYFQVSPDYFPPEFNKCFLVLPSIHFVKLCWLHVWQLVYMLVPIQRNYNNLLGSSLWFSSIPYCHALNSNDKIEKKATHPPPPKTKHCKLLVYINRGNNMPGVIYFRYKMTTYTMILIRTSY